MNRQQTASPNLSVSAFKEERRNSSSSSKNQTEENNKSTISNSDIEKRVNVDNSNNLASATNSSGIAASSDVDKNISTTASNAQIQVSHLKNDNGLPGKLPSIGTLNRVRGPRPLPEVPSPNDNDNNNSTRLNSPSNINGNNDAYTSTMKSPRSIIREGLSTNNNTSNKNKDRPVSPDMILRSPRNPLFESIMAAEDSSTMRSTSLSQLSLGSPSINAESWSPSMLAKNVGSNKPTSQSAGSKKIPTCLLAEDNLVKKNKTKLKTV